MTVVTQTVARLLLLPTLMAAMAILVKGYSDTGDGFSAGVVAAFAVLLQYVAFGYRDVARYLPVHLAPAVTFVGLLLSFLVVFGPGLWGTPPVTHFPPPGAEVIHLGTLELHSALLFDVGVFLLVLGFTVHTMSTIAHAAEAQQSR
ncbi:MAG: MnhB domain-containing protein [Chloroflexota bacterium]|nr:MnhB domain-containing protein [Chloroflexota bacterium]